MDSWDMRLWAMAHQALGLPGLGAPDLTTGLLTYKLLLTYHKERNPSPWSQNTSLSTSDPEPLLLSQGPTLVWSGEAGG